MGWVMGKLQALLIKTENRSRSNVVKKRGEGEIEEKRRPDENIKPFIIKNIPTTFCPLSSCKGGSYGKMLSTAAGGGKRGVEKST